MMGYGYGMGTGGWIAMTILWIALITLVIWALSRALLTGGSWGGDSARRGEGARDSAEDILDRRFATGEIDEDTYRSMRVTLRSPRTARNESR